jgi:hypothetical protein
MLYGMETIPLTKSLESRLEVAEMKMLRFSQGVTKFDKIKNVDIRQNLAVVRLGECRTTRTKSHSDNCENAKSDKTNNKLGQS